MRGLLWIAIFLIVGYIVGARNPSYAQQWGLA